MGGLAGEVRFDGTHADPGVVAAMAKALEHRGPDGLGTWSEADAAIAHRRRSVVPIRSEQPVVTDDVVLVLDGWIFDHELLSLSVGVDPTGHTDAHALLAAWRRWGAELGRHIEGEYAVAAWDRRAKVLTLIRDRLGSRPLFWTRSGGRVAFASDVPAMLAAPFVSRELRREAIAEYLSFKTVHAPRTLLKEVHQVEPGHWLQISADGVRSAQWWRARYVESTEPQPEDRLQQAVSQSVSRRMKDVQSCGLLLSGGLGSAAVAMAAKDRFIELPTFTVAFNDDPHPESAFAGRVARLFDLDHHEVLVDSKGLADAFTKTVEALGHPVAQPSAMLQYALAKGAREHVRVVLSGDGGEELFGGRMLDGIGRRIRAAQAWSRLPKPLRASAEALLHRLDRGHSLTADPNHWALEMGIGGAHLFTTADRAAVLRDPKLVRPNVRRDVLEPWYRDLDADPIHTVLHGYLRSQLQGVAITTADRTAAAAGLDVRFPLLDAGVLEAAMSLPSTEKVRRVGDTLHTRLPLRALLAGALPPALLNRPKRNLPTPLGTWLTGPGRLFLESRLQRLKEDPFELYQPEGLASLKRRAILGETAAGNQLWGLFILDAWLRNIVTSPGYQAP